MMRSVTMDTPRSELVRATEKVIREYIEESCENHLPLIQKLEDVSYNMWVESNTGFLDRSLLEVSIDDEDDGYMWDDSFMIPSLPYAGMLNNGICEDLDKSSVRSSINSSICSSISPCDESDCWIGYLAGSEDELDPDSPQRERFYSTYKSTCLILTSEKSASDETDMFGPEQSDKKRRRKFSMCSRESNDCTEQDWIVFNSNVSEDCFSEEKTTRMRSVSKDVGTIHERVVGSDEVLSDNLGLGSEECSEEPDIETWSVLTMNVTEHDYPRARRRLFSVDEGKVCNAQTQTAVQCSIMDGPWARVLFRLFLHFLRYLMQKN